MLPIVHTLKSLFADAERAAFPDIPATHSVDIAQATQERFGHYQYNSSMRLAKELKKPPREVAERLLQHLPKESEELIEKLEIAGPGFINITLKKEFLEKVVIEITKDSHLGIPPLKKKEKVIVDFSSPNTAKEMHVGHLRSTIIGDALSRHFEFLGYDVLRLNHVGDWGTSFGMLIAFMKKSEQEVLEGKKETTLSSLMEWYKKSKALFDSDEEFKKQAQLEVVKLQNGDSDSLKAWQIICEISRKNYQKIYDLLDIQLIERGESFYNPQLQPVVKELEEKGLITISDGAKCIFLEGFTNREGGLLPLMVQKSDGGFNYDTTDLAAIRHRIIDEKGDRLIYVTDAGQATHFQMIFKAAEKASWLDPKKCRVDHVPFGLVLGPDGKKFRTRSGDTEQLIDLITNAITKAKEILQEKNSNLSSDELETLAHAIGIGAIKYADLSSNRISDYVFSYDKMLRFEGNTAAYLMYSYVRINGLKRNSSYSTDELMQNKKITLTHPKEIALALQIAQFSEALLTVVDDLLPNRMTDYLYLLAEKFHAFFRDCRVVGSEYEKERLFLAHVTALTMKQGLSLLGISNVEKM